MKQTIFTGERDGHRVREVRLDGQPVSGVYYADTAKGIVKVYDQEAPPDEHGDMQTKTLKGRVQVFLFDQGGQA